MSAHTIYTVLSMYEYIFLVDVVVVPINNLFGLLSVQGIKDTGDARLG